MLKRTTRKAACIAAACALAASVMLSPAHADLETAEDGHHYADIASTKDPARTNLYESYLSNFSESSAPNESIIIPGPQYVATDMNVQTWDRFEGSGGGVIRTDEEGFIEWEADIAKEGLYHIGIKYYPIEGKSSAIERELRIDGQLPFDEARSLSFYRIWKDAEDIHEDNRGNDITPGQIEVPDWQEVTLRDTQGYYNDPFQFYFTPGKHRIRLISIKEPMAIEYIKLFQEEPEMSYDELQEIYTQKGYKPVSDTLIKVQAEKTLYKSDPMLVPVYDRSSPSTEPYHKSKLRLNVLGGYRWSIPGQWASWEIEVPEEGLYKIAVKARQNEVRGTFVNRKLMVNGEVPFKEMKKIEFSYDPKWKMHVLGGEQPYLFHLNKGKNVIRMEITLGDLSDYLRIAENSVYELNNAYREIIMITGTIPDTFRDYMLERKIPNVLELLHRQSGILYDLSQKIQSYAGQTSTKTALLETLADQIKSMSANPDEIPLRLDAFKINVAALGTWIIEIKDQPLEVDYIIAASPEKQLPKADASFIQKMRHELMALIASFTEDYNSIGNVFDTSHTITVWTSTGRDQAQVLKNMIDSTFVPETGINVNLRLVDAAALLPAIVANKGPDVALGVANGDPVNYAIRNAVEDVTRFVDYDQVSTWFRDSALVPYKFNGGVYALPETQTFPMLFYRKDIFEQLGLDVPKTWDDVYALLPVLHRVNMNMGVPVESTDSNMLSFGMLLYQGGGEFYKEEGKFTGLDSETAIQTFKNWTELYTNYKLPLSYDLANRLRTGEMPIGVADYTLFNTLTVFAPEIRGLWGFAPVPGRYDEQGELNHYIPGSGSAVIMMKYSQEKEAAWEFMKWWTKTETQVEFGRSMESLLGAAARYPTANIEALNNLPWPVKDYKNLMAQWEWVTGIPEVPGGYFTGRHLTNAFRQVINEGDDPREVLLDYVRVINKEIMMKRIEFGLN